MTLTQLPIIKGDKIANSYETDYRDNLLVNMYAVKRDILGAKGYIIDYPGLTQFTTGTGIDRGGVYNERFNKHFRVSGNSLIEIDENGTIINLGNIKGSGQVAMPYSFNTQAVIASGRMYLYNPTSGLVEITDPDLGNPIDGAWIDGYYFLTDGEYIYHTEISDETSIDPLDYATAEFMPDESIGVSKTQDNKVNVFGSYSFEQFIDAATEDFAFQRIDARSQKAGIVGTHAKVELGGNLYIVGGRKNENPSVYILGVGSATKIANREIEKKLSGYTKNQLSKTIMESRVEHDISFLIIHLPYETICFNVTAAESFGADQAWSILKTGIHPNQRYRAINGVFDPRISKWIYGDKFDSRIGCLDNTVKTQYGENVESIFYSSLINFETQSINSIELATIPGHTAEIDAKVAISRTIDGVSYNSEYWMQYGQPTDYKKQFKLNRLGYVRHWLGLKFRSTSKARMAFSTLMVDHG